MPYPLLSEYLEAIKSSEDNFKALSYLHPVLDAECNPVMTSGNFAVVFKMKDEYTGKLYAIKCFTRNQDGRAESYKMITEELDSVDSSYIAHFKYFDKELFVDTANSDETEYPVLQMDWVEGQTLDKYIRENINDQYALEMLAYQFSRLAMWLLPQPFAHGDLKPDNIIVREDGSLVLVDYDGMYVPAMKGQKARELGSPDFRHPSRTADEFNEHIDDFPIASILLSLKAIALQPDLLEEYGAKDRLLFSTSDYCHIENSSLTSAISCLTDESLQSLLNQFKQLIRGDNYTLALSDSIEKVLRKKLMTISTKFHSSKDFKDSVKDEYGVYYSKDGTRLLYISSLQNESYVIGKRTRVICDHAFGDFFHHPSNGVKTVILSQRLVAIGDGAFWDCDIKSILLPNSLLFIGEYAFRRCKKLKTLIVPSSVIRIGKGAFSGCSSLDRVLLPNNLETIDDDLFAHCQSLKSIYLPGSIRFIGKRAFEKCTSLEEVVIPEGVFSIGEYAFSECTSLKKIILPSSLVHIDSYAFKNCYNIESITLPEELNKIGNNPFVGCCCKIICKSASFKYIDGALYSGDMKTMISYLSNNHYFSIPNRIVIIGNSCFQSLKSIQKVSIPPSTIIIDDFAFEDCSNLKEVLHNDSIRSIGWGAFHRCSRLSDFIFPSKIESLGKDAFGLCLSLKSVVLPTSLKHIGINPFRGCKCSIANKSLYFKFYKGSLYSFDMKHLISIDDAKTTYKVPKSVVSIGNEAFHYKCVDVFLSKNITYIGEKAFFGAFGLKHIYIPIGSLDRFKVMIKEKRIVNLLVEKDSGIFSFLFS